MSLKEAALQLHKDNRGKISVESKVPVRNREELSLAYTPGVAEPCRQIDANRDDVYLYTAKGNMVAVVSDGSAVLGLGNIGPEAALPVMEGKAILFKSFAGVDAFPICLDTQDSDEIVKTVKYLAPSFGGVNLEDISAPRCFEIEARLKAELDIPVFHDDQHGTAVIVLAAIYNSLKLVNKQLENLKVVVNGGGAAGIAISKILLQAGVKDLYIVDKNGVICQDDPDSMLNWAHEEMAAVTNIPKIKGSLADVIKNVDVFIGVSRPNLVTREMVASMNEKAIVFAMANPDPEILPGEALAGGAMIVGTGRSDYPNQVNNVLAFPGIFRGALDVRAKDINDAMKIAAARAIASCVPEEKLSPDYILPAAFDPIVSTRVAEAVARAAIESGVAKA
ncbi:MAG: NAD(P)-dependent malic enzyme [Syntrophomonadaceae bacterium]|jgi:malate dehydrogenase (oxaloacetate-decarboxylating)